MNILTRYGLAWLALAFVGYSALVFLAFPQSNSFWLGYGVTAAVFLLNGAVLWYFFGKRMEPRQQIYSVALTRWTLLYGLVQIVLSMALIGFQEHVAPTVAGCTYLLLFVIYGCLAIPAKAAEASMKRQDSVHTTTASIIRQLQGKIVILQGLCPEPSAQAALRAVGEALRFSDPCATKATIASEKALEGLVATLSKCIDCADWGGVRSICTQLRQTLDARNQLCKQTKTLTVQ